MYEKRDGGIINKILTEEGVILFNPKGINEELAKTIKEIQVDNNWRFLEKKPFPKLPRLDQDHIEDLLSRLSTHKAIMSCLTKTTSKG